ncbi:MULTISPECIES: helix-turn-helix domain-containing protein [Lactobacillaceae]|uniref:helix-turn-helix domain-containing protein n=1 Tax=Lactobacillaceae TaxID=33958 RepID=UPI001CCA1234|nr:MULTISPECIES: helix-turn-helix transcriptional regulator [Lactobacillaceae]MCT3569517.1 XRE family transcriptional regulator [Levilactobacillus brevis]
MQDLKDFNNFISESVSLLEQKKGITHEQVASYLGVSETFIKHVNSNRFSAHYNVFHLWKLSKLFNVELDQLTPPLNDFSSFKKVRRYATQTDYEEFIKKYQSKEVI